MEEETLKNIINLAVLVPSAFNLQPWEIIALKSDEAKERFFKLAYNQPKIKEAPVTLILVGDKRGYDKSNPVWEEMLNSFGGDENVVKGSQDMAAALYGTKEEDGLKFAESNVGLLASSIMYAAKYYGVDSHAMSGIDFEGVKKEFGLDENKTVVMAISLGYFDESKELYPRRPRRGYDEIVKEI
ncbi:nitroreductase family protein [Clostridium polynesiense]|uniref:nitroreductase family protein n=1 Tax=Clostridium polynesiense TaxID=1325933 RepID=UPI0009E1C267